MRILEYKLHAPTNGHGMSTPSWVENGGYWHNQDDHTFIGFAPASTEYYIPDSVEFKTLAELKARQVAYHAKYPYKKVDDDGKPTDDDMSNSEVEAMVDEWHTAHTS